MWRGGRCFLCLETSGPQCSVALALADGRVFSREGTGSNDHSAALTCLVQDVLRDSGIHFKDLDAVVVSAGPGSYTGLRIGFSTAKGLCFGLSKPLIAVSTLQALALGMRQVVGQPAPGDVFIPMIDARRMEVYTQGFGADLRPLGTARALILTEELPPVPIDAGRIFYGGSGARKAVDLLEPRGWNLLPEILPRADLLLEPAIERYETGNYEDLAYTIPCYIKEFVANDRRPGVLDAVRAASGAGG